MAAYNKLVLFNWGVAKGLAASLIFLYEYYKNILVHIIIDSRAPIYVNEYIVKSGSNF